MPDTRIKLWLVPAALAAVLGGCDTASSDPAGVYATFVEAHNAHDADALLNCLWFEDWEGLDPTELDRHRQAALPEIRRAYLEENIVEFEILRVNQTAPDRCELILRQVFRDDLGNRLSGQYSIPMVEREGSWRIFIPRSPAPAAPTTTVEP